MNSSTPPPSALAHLLRSFLVFACFPHLQTLAVPFNRNIIWDSILGCFPGLRAINITDYNPTVGVQGEERVGQILNTLADRSLLPGLREIYFTNLPLASSDFVDGWLEREKTRFDALGMFLDSVQADLYFGHRNRFAE